MGGEEVPAGFGAVLKRYRLRAGWTQETLAERAGISARAVSDLERGLIRAPQRSTLVRLVGALGLDADERREAEAVAVAVRHRPRPRAMPRAVGGRAHNLPAPLTSFVGRDEEVPAVRAAVAGHRLVTLTGPGGTGKTRLALEAAAGLLGGYPHGVWLIELAALTDGAPVAHATAAAVGVRERAGRSLVDALAEALRPRHALLVLDNCEHLVDACAGLTHALLRACPRVHILVTSREALGLAEEVVWRVPPLAVPPPGAPDRSSLSPPAVTRYPAVQLFRDRALAVQPAFRITDANAPAVAQVCVRLDGIPLALELAAAALRVLSVEQLLGRLDDRFRLLTGGRRTALERHRTLRAMVDWSYERLGEPERRLFDRLAVFAGGWTLEAAEAVGAGDGLARADVLAALVRLVDTSLVLVDVARPAGPRYRLLETLRQYGQRPAGGRRPGHGRLRAARGLLPRSGHDGGRGAPRAAAGGGAGPAGGGAREPARGAAVASGGRRGGPGPAPRRGAVALLVDPRLLAGGPGVAGAVPGAARRAAGRGGPRRRDGRPGGPPGLPRRAGRRQGPPRGGPRRRPGAAATPPAPPWRWPGWGTWRSTRATSPRRAGGRGRVWGSGAERGTRPAPPTPCGTSR